MDFSSFQKTLAQNKVYDAWQYVQSLNETLAYMNMSAELLEKVYAHRIAVLESSAQGILRTAVETGKASVTEETLRATHLDIADFELNDAVFLKKTSLEFFHYARLSMDVLFQIINASLLGDSAIAVEDKGIISKLLTAVGREPNFAALKTMLDAVKIAPEFCYLQGLDNHVKHIKTVLVSVSNSFILGNQNTFQIDGFSYGGIEFLAYDAITKVREIQAYVNQTIDKILLETERQVPNCLDTKKRIQNLNFYMQVQEHDGVIGIGACVALLFGGVSSCSMMAGSGVGGVFTSSYLSEDADMLAAEAAYCELEQALQYELDHYETLHPGYDEYRFDLDEIEHDPYVLISILTAFHEGVFTIDAVQAELQMLFEKQYILTQTVEVEVRYRTETRTDSEGNDYDVEVLYERRKSD